jgi:hypothetical protein
MFFTEGQVSCANIKPRDQRAASQQQQAQADLRPPLTDPDLRLRQNTASQPKLAIKQMGRGQACLEN